MFLVIKITRSQSLTQHIHQKLNNKNETNNDLKTKTINNDRTLM